MSEAFHSVKVYVQVKVVFDETGLMHPRAVEWEDGLTYHIDRVLDIRPSYAARAGGQGDRYKVRIGGQETYLFFEHNADISSPITGRWFVERRGM